MNDTDLIKAIRELAADHATCDPSDGWCALQSDLNQLLKEHDSTPVYAYTGGNCLTPGCTSILTITDSFQTCRQCVLQGVR